MAVLIMMPVFYFERGTVWFFNRGANINPDKYRNHKILDLMHGWIKNLMLALDRLYLPTLKDTGCRVYLQLIDQK